MNNVESEDIIKRLLVARNTYAEQLSEKIKLIEDYWIQLQDEWNVEKSYNLLETVHNLSGSGGTFGFLDVGNASKQVEKYLVAFVKNTKQPKEVEKNEITNQINNLKKITIESLKNKEEIISALPKISVSRKIIAQDIKKVFIVEDDVVISAELSSQLSCYGYSTYCFETLCDFQKTIDNNIPAVIIMDISLPDGNGADYMKRLNSEQKLEIPIIYMSSNGDINSRLKTIHAGGVAYFLKPLDILRIIETLDTLTSEPEVIPYKILIIEDLKNISQYIGMILEKAGMETRIENNPLNVLNVLNEFQPDLILMDVYMPECSGSELARIIRQLESFVSTPIVYLSGEGDIIKQLDAIKHGGDDFLSKPIHPNHLVMSVTSRIERFRALRSYMIKDSLTGLFNHATILEQLTQEVALSKRQNGKLVFAMIDLDHFKAVNDTYGHSAGDRVLVSLARLLKQRLRSSDVIGRYGGEEFSIIFPDTDVESAMVVVDELRISFSEIQHYFNEDSFSVTFSCGLASFPTHLNTASIIDSADKAMYIAKEERNKIVASE
ncbi:MAG: diguanylate cyclase [Alphaproteobacteria bacterium]|nr:diguanylate cyclase [Alphaproteobacteria bacterium]